MRRDGSPNRTDDLPMASERTLLMMLFLEEERRRGHPSEPEAISSVGEESAAKQDKRDRGDGGVRTRQEELTELDRSGSS